MFEKNNKGRMLSFSVRPFLSIEFFEKTNMTI